MWLNINKAQTTAVVCILKSILRRTTRSVQFSKRSALRLWIKLHRKGIMHSYNWHFISVTHRDWLMSCLVCFNIWHGYLLITFRVSCRRREMYSGHARLCVCLSVCPSPHSHTTALLGGFAVGARVSLLWQHSANAKCQRVLVLALCMATNFCLCHAHYLAFHVYGTLLYMFYYVVVCQFS